MNASTTSPPPSPTPRPLALKVLAAMFALFLVLVLVISFFPWDVLRGPINRYVSEKTGRKFEITRHLDIGFGLRAATVKFDGIEFSNPSWARDPYLVKADRAEFDIRLWPLLAKKVVIPRLSLTSPVFGLQMEQDGRRTWALGKDTSDTSTAPIIGLLQVDGGAGDFLAKHLGVDLHVDFNFDTSRGQMPLDYKIKGTYQKQPLTAVGRTGNVLQLNATGAPPFPLVVKATAGHTTLGVNGTVAELSTLEGIDAKFDIKGQNLGDLFPLLGIALPQTSPYALKGELRKNGKVWSVTAMNGKLGLSDIGGDMKFDQGKQLPYLSGALRSRVMDMDDLGPLIGLPPTERSANAVEGVVPPPNITQVKKARRDPGTRVLPTAPLDFERLRAMNADVSYVADRITNVRQVPLDRGSVKVKLADGVLTLDPLDLGVASGRIGGAIRIDAAKSPADIRASLDVRGMQLNRLIPKIQTLKASFGKLDGRVNLSGQGNSVASWLATASGDIAAITGKGEFSNLLLEFLGLDGGEIIKFLLKGDHTVTLRCGAVALNVDKGLMSTRTIVLDTDDTVFNATGNASFVTESLDFVIKAQPKDMSILSLRTPLTIKGTFGSPKPFVELTSLAGRGLAALALGAINPLLALAATIETGPGQDADCQGVLADAQRPGVGAAATGAVKAKTAKTATVVQ